MSMISRQNRRSSLARNIRQNESVLGIGQFLFLAVVCRGVLHRACLRLVRGRTRLTHTQTVDAHTSRDAVNSKPRICTLTSTREP